MEEKDVLFPILGVITSADIIYKSFDTLQPFLLVQLGTAVWKMIQFRFQEKNIFAERIDKQVP